jgi:hypothetical protein
MLDRLGPLSVSLSWTLYSQINVPVTGWLEALDKRPLSNVVFTTGVDAVFEMPTRGLWLELGVPLSLTQNLEVALYGRYLVNMGENGASVGGQATQTRNNANPSTQALSLLPNVNTEWFGAELEGTYRWSMINILVGLRYDNLTAKLTGGRDNLTSLFFSGLQIDQAWIELNSLVPYVGVGTQLKGVEVNFKGFPALVIGTANVQEGYYAELMARWTESTGVSGFTFSLFGKLTATTAIFDEVPVDIYRYEAGSNPLLLAPTPWKTELGREGNIVVSWRELALGASFNYEFLLPL